MGRLGLRAPLLVLLGRLALGVSFVLTPTPDTFDVLANGHRIRVDAAMHAVDYLILVLRIGGVVVLSPARTSHTGSLRPDRIYESDRPGRGYDRSRTCRPRAAIPRHGARSSVASETQHRGLTPLQRQ